MINYKEEKTECIDYIPDGIICDRCQREIKDFEEFLKIRHEFGYGTPNDGDYLESEICEDCLNEILRNNNITYRLYKNSKGTE